MTALYAHNTGEKRKVGLICPYCIIEPYLNEQGQKIEDLKQKEKGHLRRIGELEAEALNPRGASNG